MPNMRLITCPTMFVWLYYTLSKIYGVGIIAQVLVGHIITPFLIIFSIFFYICVMGIILTIKSSTVMLKSDEVTILYRIYLQIFEEKKIRGHLIVFLLQILFCLITGSKTNVTNMRIMSVPIVLIFSCMTRKLNWNRKVFYCKNRRKLSLFLFTDSKLAERILLHLAV